MDFQHSPLLRTRTIEEIDRYTCRNSAIKATLLVGSGATGFTDEYSDIDIVMVTDPNDYAFALNDISHFLKSLNPIFMTVYKHHKAITVICTLLSNNLKIDVGIWSIDVLFAPKSEWKILNYKSNYFRTRTINALQSASPIIRKREPVYTGDNSLWQEVLATYIADKRRKTMFLNKKRSLRERLEVQDYSPDQKRFLLKFLN